MITKAQALHEFFGTFGVPAYVATSVPDMAEMPYLTYTYGVSGFDMGSYSATVNLYYRTESEALPNAKVDEMFEAIGEGGCTVPYDGGIIWIKPGTPWCNSVAEPDATVKRRYMNVEIEYL